MALLCAHLMSPENRFKQLEDLINDYELSLISSEGASSPLKVALDQVKRSNPYALEILGYLSWLNPNNISIQSVLMEILNLKDSKQHQRLFDAINELERLSLLSVVGHRGKQHIVMSRTVQDQAFKFEG
jgi:hypothetical protein